MVANTHGGNGSGPLITQNDLNTSGANSIRLNPISVQGINGVTISNNNMGNISDANAEQPVGIVLASGTDNANVTGNVVNGITSTSATSSGGAEGILVSVGANPTSINVSNNTISALTAAGPSNVPTGGTFGLASFSPNVTLNNNNISSISSSGAVNIYGIVLSGANNSTISGNTVSTMSSTANIPFG